MTGCADRGTPQPISLNPLSGTRAAAVLLVVFLAACGGADKEANATRQGTWRPGQEWHLVEEARIGTGKGADSVAFANVVDATLDLLGRVWVADAQQHRITIFDAHGRTVRSIGRKGGGPAEFGGIAGMAWAPDGTLWVLDDGNARFAVYDTAGALVATHPRNSMMTTSPWPGRFDSRGRLYDVTGTIQGDGSIRTSVVRHDAGGEPRDTFPLPAFRTEYFEIERGDAHNRRVTRVTVPFTGRQIWGVDPLGDVWVANTARYRIERYGFDGRVRTVVERPDPRVPVSREERDRIVQSFADFTRQGGRIDVSRIPDHHPPLAGFLFDDAARLWTLPITRPGEPRALDVMEADGTYLGRVTLPGPYRSTPRSIRGNRMVVVVRDDDDVPSLTVMRIEKPER